jgi:transcriptional regulator with XRE-family HTH domain
VISTTSTGGAGGVSLASGEENEATESIGSRLRRRRKALRMTLKDVATAAGLAESFLSQLERGIHTGSIRTLQKICDVLGLAVGDLFLTEQNEGPRPTRFSTSEGFSFGVDARKVRLTPRSFDHLEVFIGVLEPHGSTGVEPYSHGDSEELVLVIEGEVEVTIGEQSFRLGPLDSVPYLSTQPHRVAEVAGSQAKVLWAMAPPSF